MRTPKYDLRLNPSDRARLEAVHAALGVASGMNISKMAAFRWAIKCAEEALGIAAKPPPPEGVPQAPQVNA